MKLDVARFAGEIPVLKGSDLPEYAASQAQNIYTAEGRLEPMRALSAPLATLGLSAIKSIYRFGAVWFAWQQDVNVCKSPMVADPWERVYWSGQGEPRFTHAAIATSGSNYPSNSLLLGVPAPATAPVATLGAASGTNTDYEDDETRFYVATYVNQFGEEGAPSPVSNRVVVVEPAQVVQLLLPSLMDNRFGVTKCRIYRTASGSNETGFYLLAELPLAQTSYTDSKASDELGPPLATQNYDMPPADLKGLTRLSNGMLAGFVKNTVYLSEAYLPYAWPRRYRLTTEHNIVAMAATTNALIVATEGYPEIIAGVSPDAMAGERIETSAACVSAKSMVDMGEFVIYASPNGLVGISGPEVINLTEKVIAPKQWKKDYNPGTIIATCVEGKYLAFYQDAGGNKKGFIFDPVNSTLNPLSVHYPALYRDPAQDAVYVLSGSNVCQFDAGPGALPLRWRSKPFVASGIEAPNCLRVEGSQLNELAFSFLVDGNHKHTIADLSVAVRGRRLPALRGHVYQFEITGTGKLERIVLANTMEDLL